MIEVPRRQSTGSDCPREVVAEVEDGIEEVVEDEAEEHVEPGHEIGSAAACARRCFCAPNFFFCRIFIMAAPNFFAVTFTNRSVENFERASRLQK